MQNQPAPDYSFLNDNGKSRKFSFLRGGDKKQSMLIKIAAGGILLVVMLAIIAMVFGGGSGSESLVGIVARQNELIRIAERGVKDANSAETKNFASTVNLSIVSAEKQLSDHVIEQGRKLESKDLNSAKDEGTDETLTQAAQINQFDKVFNQTVQAALQAYQKALSDAFDASSSQTQKNLLQGLYQSAKVLAETVPAS